MADRDAKTKLIIEGDATGGVSAIKQAETSMGGIVQATQKAETSMTGLSTAAAAAAVGLAAIKAGQYIQDATMLAARVETLGVVMKVVGNNAGYTGAQMQGYAQAVASMGITTEAARQSVVQMASSHMDLSKAAQLARIAQDAAVIGNINSSEAFDKMIHGITSAQVEVLRTIGINVQFEASYKKLADQLGKSKDDLTEVEKIQARTNVVLEKGNDIAGAYAASMDTAGKLINSMKRPAEESALAIGQMFTPTLNHLAREFYDIASDTAKSLKNSQPTIERWGDNILRFTLQAEARITQLAMAVDVLGGTLTSAASKAYTVMGVVTRAATIGQYGKGFEDRAKGMQDANDVYRDRFWQGQYKVSGLEEKYENIGKKRSDKPDNLRDRNQEDDPTGKKGKSQVNAWESSHNAYLSYLDSFHAREVAEAKAARDKILQINEQGYNSGLVSLGQYLQTKNQAVKDELDAEYYAALESLDRRQQELVKASTGDPRKSQAENAKDYHDALKKVEEASASLTTVEAKRTVTLIKNGDEATKRLNDEAISLAAQASHWAAVRAENERATLVQESDFLAMQAAMRGDATVEEFNRIAREEQAWLSSWAMLATSDEEYEARRLRIAAYYEQQRTQVKRRETQQQLGWAASGFSSMATIADSFYQLSGKKSKEAFLAYQVTKSGETIISTGSAAMKAYDAMASIPYVGPILGAAAAAAAVAAGAVQLQSIWSASPDGGGSLATVNGAAGGVPGGGMVTQPVTPVTEPSQQVTIVLNNPIGERRWFEDNLPEIIKDMKSRNVDLGVSYA